VVTATYAMTRLVYTYTPDITTTAFSAWAELTNITADGNNMQEMDTWLGADNVLHVLWLEEMTTGGAYYTRLKYGQIASGAAALTAGQTQTITEFDSGAHGGDPQAYYARFQATPSGRLFVVFSCRQWIADGFVNSMRVVEVLADAMGTITAIPLTTPLKVFFTSGVRGGSPSTNVVDIWGTDFTYVFGNASATRLYAQVRLFARTNTGVVGGIMP
jgi:hypothetical protein